MMAEGVIIQEEIPGIVRSLRAPAGDDPQFSTMDGIRANRPDFLHRVHATWKTLHNRALDELLKVEEILQSPEVKQFPPEFVFFLHRCEAVWRRVNDAIVWSMYGLDKGHFIRRLSGRKPRPVLSEANPKAIRHVLNDFNSDPLTFALWLDATSCVDVGDILCRSASGKPNGIIEVKSGKVNHSILEMLASKPETIEARVRQIDALAKEYGLKAVKQLERVLRQQITLDQVCKILEADEGFDPFREGYVRITEASTQDRIYDVELAAMIQDSVRAPVLECIDRCLWVYIDRQARSTPDVLRNFSDMLFARAPHIQQWMKERYECDTLLGLSLDGNLLEPAAIPLFYRPFDPETIRDILIGGLSNRVLLHFDWVEYAKIIERLGAKLTWSDRKAARAQQSLPRHRRSMIVGGQIPMLSLPDGRSITGQSMIYRVLFEGILPSVIAAQYVEMLEMTPPPESPPDNWR
jgi:hypothetical protein